MQIYLHAWRIEQRSHVLPAGITGEPGSRGVSTIPRSERSQYSDIFLASRTIGKNPATAGFLHKISDLNYFNASFRVFEARNFGTRIAFI